MAHTYSHLLFHLVFSTKERRPVLDSALKERLLPYLGGIAAQRAAHLLAANGPADHLHLLVLLPPALAPAEFARAVKGSSSKWIHEAWPERRFFAWQEGYSVFSVSSSASSRVQQYIAEQEEHHRQTTFQDELRALLTRHGISFDERYLWG